MHLGWFRKPTAGALAPRRDIGTQQAKLFLEDIQDGVIDLGNGQYRRVLEVSAYNLDLVSPEEQEQIVASFRAFLNGLSFPVQILVRIEHLNVADYLTRLGACARSVAEPRLRDLALAQLGFVRELAASRTLLQRRFLLVVPSATLAPTPSADRTWLGLVPRPTRGLPMGAQAQQQLVQRTADVIRGLEAVGVRAWALETDEVLALYHLALCPTQARLQPLRQSLTAATTPAIRGVGPDSHPNDGGA